MSTSSLDSLINRLARASVHVQPQQCMPTSEPASEELAVTQETQQQQEITVDDTAIINELLGDFLIQPQPVQEVTSEPPIAAQQVGEVHQNVESSLENFEVIQGLRTEYVREPVRDSVTTTHSLADLSTSRFSGAEWYSKVREKDITIIGCGGIGSWTALMISRFAPRTIILYDPDVIELANMAGQFYKFNDVGKTKVDATSRSMSEYSNFYNTVSVYERFNENSDVSDVVITCLDNMDARKTAFNVWRKHVQNSPNQEECLFIDGRLAAETLQIFAVQGNEPSSFVRYENTLFENYEADAEICSYKQTSFMANMIGSLIANVFVNFIASKQPRGALREIPFKIEYMAEPMWLKIDM